MDPQRRNLLIGGMIILAVPFVAGLLRKGHVHLPRMAMIGLVMLAAVGALIGLFVMFARPKDRN
jgi:hypothetical protein